MIPLELGLVLYDLTRRNDVGTCTYRIAQTASDYWMLEGELRNAGSYMDTTRYSEGGE
jgi:hypothetical protein